MQNKEVQKKITCKIIHHILYAKKKKSALNQGSRKYMFPTPFSFSKFYCMLYLFMALAVNFVILYI